MELFGTECIDDIKSGNNEMMYEKANMLYNDEEYEDAVEYYRLSAAMGNANAITRIGCCYFDGKGVIRDYAKARVYFKLGVTHGDINSLYKLGDLYIDGLGVKKDERKAIEYYVESYNLVKSQDEIYKYPEVLLRVAKVFMEGKYLEQNYEMARQFLEVAKEGFEEKLDEDIRAKDEFFEATKCLDELDSLENNNSSDCIEGYNFM